MNCLRCGRKIPDDKFFCLECSETVVGTRPGQKKTHITLPTEPTETEVKTAEPVASKAPQKAAAKAPAQPAKQSTNAAPSGPPVVVKRTPLWMKIALGVAVCACVGLSFALSSVRSHYNSESYRDEQITLHAKAAELTEVSKLLKQSQNDLDLALREQTSLQEQLGERAKEIRALNEQLNSYAQQSSDAELDLEDLETQNADLVAQVEEYNEKVAKQSATINSLTTELYTLRAKSSFVDAHVVFVENDGTNLYHTFTCSHFLKNNYWVYSLNLAVANGLTPCPDCHEAAGETAEP